MSGRLDVRMWPIGAAGKPGSSLRPAIGPFCKGFVGACPEATPYGRVHSLAAAGPRLGSVATHRPVCLRIERGRHLEFGQAWQTLGIVGPSAEWVRKLRTTHRITRLVVGAAARRWAAGLRGRPGKCAGPVSRERSLACLGGFGGHGVEPAESLHRKGELSVGKVKRIRK